MKRLLLGILIFFFFLPSQVFSHGPGEDPYLKINEKYTTLYSVFGTSLEGFVLPQDLAPDVYLVNESISFELETAKLPLPEEVVKNAKFLWDFGDGRKAEGLTHSHTYTKKGSYFMTVHIQYTGDTGNQEPQLLQTTLIHVVPDKKYTLPVAVMTVNDQIVKDPLVDTQRLSLSQEIQFDAGKSRTQGKIIDYFWDFGDKKSQATDSPDVTYTYNEKEFQYGLPIVFPLLRIKTADGFIADTYAQINNAASADVIETSEAKPKNNIASYAAGGLGIVMLLIAARYFVGVKRK